MLSSTLNASLISLSTVAIVCNIFVVAIILIFSSQRIGSYKWCLVYFCVMEAFYAAVVLVGTPIHLIADNSWIVFSYNNILAYNRFLPGIYCVCYQLWIGYVDVLFVYRYVIVCRREWKNIIQHSRSLKLFLFFLYVVHFIYCWYCGVYLCMKNEISPAMTVVLQNMFNVTDIEKVGYMYLRFRKLDGSISWEGSIATFNHYLLIAGSFFIVLLCSLAIRRKFIELIKNSNIFKEFTIQRQIFRVLLAQTVIPLLLCHGPTLAYLTFPFWLDGWTFGSTSVISVLTTLPKILDPLATVLFIEEYRNGTKHFFQRTKELIAKPFSKTTGTSESVGEGEGPVTGGQPSDTTKV